MNREPHDRTYRIGEQLVVMHVDSRGMVTMAEEQVAAVLSLLGCVEVAS